MSATATKPKCSIEGCDRPQASKDTCEALQTMGYANHTTRCEAHVASALRILMGKAREGDA